MSPFHAIFTFLAVVTVIGGMLGVMFLGSPWFMGVIIIGLFVFYLVVDSLMRAAEKPKDRRLH